jgi:hypothetical protein
MLSSLLGSYFAARGLTMSFDIGAEPLALVLQRAKLSHDGAPGGKLTTIKSHHRITDHIWP